MKYNEVQLDNVLSHRAVDAQVHVIHSKKQEWTISYIITDRVNDVEMQGIVVSAAAARRNPADNFNRRLGRLISKGRLANDGETHTILSGEDVPATAQEWRELDRLVINTIFPGDTNEP
jgi:hypothetical protein